MKNKILIIFFLFFSISLKKVFGQNDDRLKGIDNELNKVLKRNYDNCYFLCVYHTAADKLHCKNCT